MKSNKRSSNPKAEARAAPPTQHFWYYVLAGLAALFVGFEIYAPAIRGPFLFDDRYLPFFLPDVAGAPLRSWLMGVRPLLMFTYWLNYQISPTEPYWYHVLNVFFHIGNALLIWLIVQRILEWAGVAGPLRRILAIFSGALFLVHPIQTEAVAYVASRSENLSVMLFNSALAIFVYRRSIAVSLRVAAAIVILFIGACVTKEHAAVLPALLLLTDYFWNPGFSFDGIRRNWKLYLPLAAGAIFAGVWIAHILTASGSAGFALKDLTWSDYFFTQCRAIWVYLRMFVLPFGQNVDHDFAISHGALDHGALLGLLALAAVSVAAWIYRRAYPLASYGWFAFLILLAPTSSFIPIKDVLVERRLYLPFLGLLLMCCEFLRRLRVTRTALTAALAGVAALFAIATYQRNNVWSDSVALWKDTVEKSPNRSRPRFQLAYAYYSEGRCAEAATEYERASQVEKPDYSLYVDWALAYDCAQQPEAALEKLHQAAALERTAHAYATMAKIYAEHKRYPEALKALDQAEKLDPSFELTYVYRGNVYLLTNEGTKAVDQFRRALSLNPTDMVARNGLEMALRQIPPRM